MYEKQFDTDSCSNRGFLYRNTSRNMYKNRSSPHKSLDNDNSSVSSHNEPSMNTTQIPVKHFDVEEVKNKAFLSQERSNSPNSPNSGIKSTRIKPPDKERMMYLSQPKKLHISKKKKRKIKKKLLDKGIFLNFNSIFYDFSRGEFNSTKNRITENSKEFVTKPCKSQNLWN